MQFPEPPTSDTLADAQRSLTTTIDQIRSLTHKISAAETTLANLIRDHQNAIDDLQRQRDALQSDAAAARAYLSPIRRLPIELLRMIFLWSFQEHPCSAWVMAAVNVSCRRLALRIPVIWSKIRLLTNQHASADTIRLWLERSGDSTPLDIEIFLRVNNNNNKSAPEATSTRPRRTSSSPITPQWNGNFSHPASSSPYGIPHAPPPPPIGNVTIMPPSPTSHHEPLPNPHERSMNAVSRVSMHWGHIAFFYLVEQMHRWERFVFRFDKQFTSMGALKSITGDAPLLKEFEVSSSEAAFFAEWPWLPNAAPSSSPQLPKLRTVTLQHTPFKWSSPMLRDLHTLSLRALPTSHLPLDRILYILSNNPDLKTVSLHFQGALAPILPLTTLTLPHVTSLTLGGHYFLTQLLDSLILPALDSLTIDIEAREPIEDIVSSLLARSNRPPIQHLSVAYGVSANASTFFYGPGGIVITWTNLLGELPHLKTLNIGGTSIEPLLSALGPPDDDPHVSATWVCPALESLGMRCCHTHGDGVQRLVQMIEARNPEGGGLAPSVGGVVPGRIGRLELRECAALGEDVMKWLGGRIADVVCVDPAYDRSALHPYL